MVESRCGWWCTEHYERGAAGVCYGGLYVMGAELFRSLGFVRLLCAYDGLCDVQVNSCCVIAERCWCSDRRVRK